MRLIDVDDKENITIVFDNEGRGIIKRIDAPTVQAVPLSVLQEIRQEISDLKQGYMGSNCVKDDWLDCKSDVLEIIDKHIKEIEDEDNRLLLR